MLGFNFLLELKWQRFLSEKRAIRGCGCGHKPGRGFCSALCDITKVFCVFTHTLWQAEHKNCVKKLLYLLISQHFHHTPKQCAASATITGWYSTLRCCSQCCTYAMPFITNSRYCPGYDYIPLVCFSMQTDMNHEAAEGGKTAISLKIKKNKNKKKGWKKKYNQIRCVKAPTVEILSRRKKKSQVKKKNM